MEKYYLNALSFLPNEFFFFFGNRLNVNFKWCVFIFQYLSITTTLSNVAIIPTGLWVQSLAPSYPQTQIRWFSGAYSSGKHQQPLWIVYRTASILNFSVHPCWTKWLFECYVRGWSNKVRCIFNFKEYGTTYITICIKFTKILVINCHNNFNVHTYI